MGGVGKKKARELFSYDNFLERRKKQIENSRKNECLSRLSRMGYDRLKKRLQSEPHIQEIDRSVLWIKGREKYGVFLRESTKKCADKIVSCIHVVMEKITEKVKSGEVQVEGTNDILTIVLEKPKPSGRVRGLGQYASRKESFNLTKKHMSCVLAKKDEFYKKKLLVLDVNGILADVDKRSKWKIGVDVYEPTNLKHNKEAFKLPNSQIGVI